MSRASPFGADVDRSILAGDPPSAAVIARLAEAHTGTLGTEGREGAAAGLVEQLVGLGPLAAPAADPAVTDVLVNGDGSVWLDRGSGSRWRPCGCPPTTCGAWPCAWPGSPADGSTTPSRGSTGCCPAVCACTPSSRRWRRAGRT